MAELAKMPKSKAELFHAALDARKKRWEETLPKNTITAQRFVMSAMLAVVKNPKLLECEGQSIMSCLNAAVNLGLDVSGRNNSAHLVPYAKTCTLIVGYGGMIDLATRGGKVLAVRAFLIREGDEVVVEYGTRAGIRHLPSWGQEGKVLGAYAVADIRDAAPIFTPIMPIAEINRIRDRSAGYQAARKYNKPSPWDTDFAEMAKKTAVRRLYKMLPITVEEIQRALEVDERADSGLAPVDMEKAVDGVLDAQTFSQLVSNSVTEEQASGAPGVIDKALEAPAATIEPPVMSDDDRYAAEILPLPEEIALATPEQVKKMCAMQTAHSISEANMKAWLQKKYNVSSRKALNRDQVQEVISVLAGPNAFDEVK